MEADMSSLPPGVGRLGESVEEHERARVAGLAAAGPQPPVPVRERAELPAASEIRTAKAVVREMLGQVGGEVRRLADAVHDQNATLRTLDVPLEQVADSHERATHSFETLRADIVRIEDRLGLVEAVCRQILAELRKPTSTGRSRVGHDEHGAAFPAE